MNDIKALQFLCSRLCHDLVSGASAINAGLELLDLEQELSGEALKLIKDSAEQVTNRLLFFRVAFGSIDQRPNRMSNKEIKKICEGFINQNKISLEWPIEFSEHTDSPFPLNVTQVFFNLVLLAVSCLPRGGVIKARFPSLDGGEGVALELSGPDCTIMKEHILALQKDCSQRDLNPKNISTLYAQALTQNFGGEIKAEPIGERKGIKLQAFLPDI
mgnify:FL=1